MQLEWDRAFAGYRGDLKHIVQVVETYECDLPLGEYRWGGNST